MKTKIIIGVVILVVAGLFALGVLDKRRWSGEARNLYYSGKDKLLSKQDAPRDSESARLCRENLKQIESAKRAVADKEGRTTGEVSWAAVLKEMNLKSEPKCPNGGEYTLGKLGETPRCSLGAGGNNDPSDDHILKNF